MIYQLNLKKYSHFNLLKYKLKNYLLQSLTCYSSKVLHLHLHLADADCTLHLFFKTFANQPPVFTISFHLREIPL